MTIASDTDCRERPGQAIADEFCDALWLEDGLSRNTLSGYRRDLVLFSAWLAKERGRNLGDAAHADLQDYIRLRAVQGVRPATSGRLLSSLKRFYRHQVRQGQRESDPTLNIDAPRLPRVHAAVTRARRRPIQGPRLCLGGCLSRCRSHCCARWQANR